MDDTNGVAESRLDEVLIDSSRLDRYYTGLSVHNSFWHRIWMVVLLLSSLLAGAGEIASAFVSEQHATYVSGFSIVCFLIVACTSVIMLVYDFSRKAGIYQVIGEQCRDISRECIQMLYQKPVTEHQMKQISEFEIRITNVTKVEIKNNEELNKKCYTEALQSVSRIKEAIG